LTLKGRILTLVAIPLAGLAVIAAANGFMLRHVSGVVKHAVGQNLLPIITEEIPLMNDLNNSIEFLLNANRDAYQGYLVEMQVLTAQSESRVAELIGTHGTEIGQVSERVGLASAQFDEQGRQTYAEYGRYFDQWKASTDSVMQTSLILAREFERREGIYRESVKSFDVMRQQLDDVVGLIEKEIESLQDAEDKTRQLALFESIELLLNADRDAYQALVALLEYSHATDETRFTAMVETYVSEYEQVLDRTQQAAAVYDEAMRTEYGKFVELLKEWNGLCLQVADITGANLARVASSRCGKQPEGFCPDAYDD